MSMCGFSWFIPYMENADSLTKVRYSGVRLWFWASSEEKCRVYYLTDIMSSLCHPPSKSPWSIIKENHHRAYMHWLLIWFLKKCVHLSPLHEGLQEDREAQWKREQTCQSDHVSFSTSFQGNSRDSSNCL